MAVRKAETFPPVTMGHIPGHGCRDLLVYCISGFCNHSATINADWLSDDVPVRSLCRNRRAILAGAAAMPATPLAVSAIAAGPDPIFAAIEQHRGSSGPWIEQVTVEMDLEEQIPFERRKNYHITHRDDPTVGVNDDPRWTEAHSRLKTCAGAGPIAVRPKDRAPALTPGLVTRDRPWGWGRPGGGRSRG